MLDGQFFYLSNRATNPPSHSVRWGVHNGTLQKGNVTTQYVFINRICMAEMQNFFLFLYLSYTVTK
jgi:hypothetical protein